MIYIALYDPLRYLFYFRAQSSQPFFFSNFLLYAKPYLQVKDLLEDGHGVLGPLDRVADGAGILVDFVVVAANGRLVAKEVNLFVGDAVGLLGLVLEVLEAVRLVPAGGEDVERDLAANGEAVCCRVSNFNSKNKKKRRTSDPGGRISP